MHLLVTGSNGFIGRNFCAWCHEHYGWEITGLDLSESSRIPVEHYVQYSLGPAGSIDALDDAMSGVDAVVHFAADMRREPHNVAVVRDNCTGTQMLLEACERAGVSCFVQLSSLPVIGHPVEHPIDEHHPLKPPTVYHATKVMDELLANYADYARGIRGVSLRICAPVGEGVKPTTIFPTFVRNALDGKDIVLYGKGTRKQTFIHVYDIAQAICKAITSENAHGVYNLASRNLISNMELAEKCIEILGSSSQIVYNGQPDPSDDEAWDVCIDRLEKDTGYEPKLSIDECIRRQAAYLAGEENASK